MPKRYKVEAVVVKYSMENPGEEGWKKEKEAPSSKDHSTDEEAADRDFNEKKKCIGA
jgi:hypothetical protein